MKSTSNPLSLTFNNFLQDENKKTKKCLKVDGDFPADIAAFYTRLANGDLQVSVTCIVSSLNFKLTHKNSLTGL